ncbi:MAG: restriction endonuclease subunit S [Planktothrix sp.]|uniref:restriction endonuclease subunit S n=1 Tax=Planktothrix sp. TaxID=3088171 RepID=UPI0038D50E17
MSDVVNKLWGFCHTLRHDGIDYGDYIEQLTYLLFLKMADEKGIDIPRIKIFRDKSKWEDRTNLESNSTQEETKAADWNSLKSLSGNDLTDHYLDVLRTLREAPGILGDIFAQSMPRFNNPVNLKKIINMIDEEEWTSLDVDVKAAAFEGLLEKAASEGKKGAGQYFTPRVLIQSIVRVMKPNPLVSPQFKICDPACGTVSLEIIKSHPLALAPLNEQRRIVEKLEKLLAKVDTCKQRLDKIPNILKRFRQSVLAAACSGRLTADWRENNPDIESAEDLLKRIQEKKQRWYEEECKKAEKDGRRKPKDQTKNKKSRSHVAELPDIPLNWTIARLEDISYLVTDGTHKTPKYQPEGKPFLSVKNVRQFTVKDKDIKFISEAEFKEINSRCNPEKGDILYTKVGATFGYAAINKLDYPFSIFVSLALIKPVSPYFSSEYAEIVINSELVFSQARERVSGIGTPDLHLIEIRDFRIPLPPLEEQKEIVNRVQTLFKLADQIEQRYQKAKNHVDQLTQSILAKAFRGELVPQDPNDEPASVLLERIRAEQTKRETETKTAKKSTGQKGKRRSKKDDVASVPLDPTPIQQKKRETETAQKLTKQGEQQELEPLQLELPLY